MTRLDTCSSSLRIAGIRSQMDISRSLYPPPEVARDLANRRDALATHVVWSMWVNDSLRRDRGHSVDCHGHHCPASQQLDLVRACIGCFDKAPWMSPQTPLCYRKFTANTGHDGCRVDRYLHCLEIPPESDNIGAELNVRTKHSLYLPRGLAG